MFLVARGPGVELSRDLTSPGGLGAAPRIAEAAVAAGRLAAMARRTQRLPAAPVPERRLVTAMRIDVVDDVCRADHTIALAFRAQRMVVQKGRAFRLPSLRAIERAGNRITVAIIVTIALTLLAPTNRAMERWTDGHGVNLKVLVTTMVTPETRTPAMGMIRRGRYSVELTQNHT